MIDGPHLKLAEVSVLPVVTTLDVNVDRILQEALDAKVSQVIIVGLDADGEFYFRSSKSDGGDVVWELEKTKLKLLRAIA